MLENESQVRIIGYGAMLTESFVAILGESFMRQRHSF
jgi:carbon starvation protein CstA